MIKKQPLIFTHQLSIISIWFYKIRILSSDPNWSEEWTREGGTGLRRLNVAETNAKLSPDAFKEKYKSGSQRWRSAAESAPAAGGGFRRGWTLAWLQIWRLNFSWDAARAERSVQQEPSAVYSIPAKLIYGHKAKNNKSKPINKSGVFNRLNKSAETSEHRRLKTVIGFQYEAADNKSN